MPISDTTPVSLRMKTLADLNAEVERARNLWPTNRHMLGALAEEFGELAKALLEGDVEQVRVEAIQVACVALRIAEEGDCDFEAFTLRPVV